MKLRNLLFVLTYLIKEVSATECGSYWDYLVSGPRGVPDKHITGAHFPADPLHLHDAKYGRLYFFLNSSGITASAWSAAGKDRNQFIQVYFSKLKIVKGVVTQGRHHYIHDQWVTTYKVSYSTDGDTWSFAKNNSRGTIFQGNSDHDTVVEHFFVQCVEALYVRIIPWTWHNHISLRFDVLGATKYAEGVGNLNRWKLHPVVFTQLEIDQLSPISNTSAINQGICATRCYQQPLCLSYIFDSVKHLCQTFQRQIFQGNKTDIAHLGGSNYFINIAYLENQEYEIEETTNICYKIYTWKLSNEAASAHCEKEGAKLISIRSLAVMKYLQNKLQNNLILSQTFLFFVDGSYNNGRFSFNDGMEIPATLWSGVGWGFRGNHRCVGLMQSGLRPTKCEKIRYFICGV